MKVFFLPRWFPVPDDPLWGLFVLRHALAVNTFADVHVIYVDKTNDGKRKSPVITEIDGIPVLYYYYRHCSLPIFGRLVMTYRMLTAWKHSWRLATSTWGRPDINHVHILTRLGLYALLVMLKFRIPYVITEHWSRYLKSNLFYTGRVRKWCTRLVVRHSGAVMPVTHDLASAMLNHKLYNRNYTVVPNVVDTNLFTPNPNSKADGKFVFIHISTFDDRAKNIGGILRVVARLAQIRDDFHVRLIGNGSDFENMKRLTASLEIPTHIISFEGAMEPNEVSSSLQESDILLMFSNYENMPVVIPEALACGLPVIATRVGGIEEVVNQSNGYLVDPGDEEALFNVMNAVVEDEILPFDRDSIRQMAVDRFSAGKVGMQIFQVYNQVIWGDDYVQEHP